MESKQSLLTHPLVLTLIIFAMMVAVLIVTLATHGGR